MRKHHVSIGLSMPRLIAGAVRGLAIANGTIVALLIYVTYRSGWEIPAAIFVSGLCNHALLAWLTSRDPWWNQILNVYNTYGDLYDSVPWHGNSHPVFRRPYGFDSDLPC
ncbi:conjugal transfer protein [Cupriavidus taiwanensis]|uniref:Type IV secretory pathway, conjugal transfert protein n=1 Tax=Cupriavidus taiwanensis TaxID=164546 RepID=A0A375JAV6_9BURK|nr:conjugal transfer protein [Cupriavidus taiwanensis]SPS02324.1 type IV secretory pathway, conjugal transfert protein [Cupriavidus taiwanensis]